MDEPLFDLGKERRVKGHGFYIRMPRAERIRAARGVRQAIVKVSSFSRGAKGIADNLRYISRKGELTLETDTGDVIKTLEEQKDLIAGWAIDFDTRKNSRDAANIIFSMPPGSSVKALRETIRTTGARAFPDNEWVFAIHEDRAHPHAHLSMKMRGRENGKKLELRKADLRQLRGIFAEAAREQGIELASSSRAERGIGRKPMRQPIYHLKKKGIKPEVDKKLRQEAYKEFIKSDWTKRPWDTAMDKRNELEREAYRKEGRALNEEAEKETNETKRTQLMKDAQLLEHFSRAMPTAKTRSRSLKEAAWRDIERKRREEKRSKERDNGLEL